MANERRLIDANALSKQMQEKVDRMTAQGYYRPAQEYMIVATIVNTAPTVDAVEVVRCRDCKKWDDDADSYGKSDGVKGKCMKSFETTGEDDFCSYGERRCE